MKNQPRKSPIRRSIIVLFGATLLLSFSLLLTSCGPKAFVKGKYDNPERENLLNDQWSETDMQNIVRDLVASLVAHPTIANAKSPPTVIVTSLQNKTSEYIDTQSIMDKFRVELSKAGKTQFIDKEARQDISQELDYQKSGMVSAETQKGPGGQIGADFILNGRLDSITQKVGKEETIYYKVTMNLTNFKTSVITWTDQKEIRKAFRKRSIGL